MKPLFFFRTMSEHVCLMFELDGKHCDEHVMLTPAGPLCVSHQKEAWQISNR